MLRALQTIAASRYVPPYNMALLYHGLGNSDEALNRLDKAYRDRDVHMVFLAVEPKWDTLCGNPRFIALLNSMNFPR